MRHWAAASGPKAPIEHRGIALSVWTFELDAAEHRLLRQGECPLNPHSGKAPYQRRHLGCSNFLVDMPSRATRGWEDFTCALVF